MPSNKNNAILLITHRPELLHNRVLETVGYEVTIATNILEARRVWKSGSYALVLIMVKNDDVSSAMKLCEEFKQDCPDQAVALLTGWYTYLPKNSCADDVIARPDGPEVFVQRVGELIETTAA